ncbi:MAG: TolC family outer membrane protein [Gammaproteobacteria bacterium]|nr:TolC family outer membrane protein [Gammaproteobacteria bacterium]
MRQLPKSLLGLILVTCSHSANALDLSEAINLAQQYDTTYQIAFATYQAQSEASAQSMAAILPQIDANGFIQRGETKSRVSGTSSTSDNNSDGYSLDLNQVIFDKTIYDNLSRGNAIVAKAAADLETARQDTILRVARAYFDVLVAIDTLDAASAAKKSIGKQLEQSKERFNVGLSAITDVKEQQASYDIASADEITAINDLSNKREALRVLINVYPENLKIARNDIPLVVPEPMDINAWQEKSLQANFSLLSAKYAVDAAQSAYDASNGGHYPTLSLNAAYSVVNTDERNFSGRIFPKNKATDNSVILNLNIPIYSGGLTSSTIRQKLAELNQAKALQEQQKRLTIALARSAYLSLEADIAKVKARKQAIISSQSSLDATQAGYDAGTRTSVDVLISQRQLFDSQRDYSIARYTYLANSLALKGVAGTLTLNDIDAINKWLITSPDKPQ